MAKKKIHVIHPRTMQNLAVCLGMLAIAIGGMVILFLGLLPAFRFGIIPLCILTGGCGLYFGSMVIFPNRLILTKKYILLKTSTGNVRMQIPYSNIAQVRLHYYGAGDQEEQVVGIDVVKATANDTWWPNSMKGRTYDIEIFDNWVKPPNAIARMIQNERDRVLEDLGRP